VFNDKTVIKETCGYCLTHNFVSNEYHKVVRNLEIIKYNKIPGFDMYFSYYNSLSYNLLSCYVIS
jgi:hypothetical protein